MPSKKKVAKAKPPTAAKPPVEKEEKPLGYFRPNTAVGVTAAFVSDGKLHAISDVLEHTKKTAKVATKGAEFAFKVLFENKYPGDRIGKIASRGLGHVTVDYVAGTVQFHRGTGNSKVIRAGHREKSLEQPIAKSTVKKSTRIVKMAGNGPACQLSRSPAAAAEAAQDADSCIDNGKSIEKQ